MNNSIPLRKAPSSQTRRLAWLLGFAAVIVLVTHLSNLKLTEARNMEQALVSIARGRLEVREGKFFRPRTGVPFSGWVTDSFASGELKLRSAVIAGLLNGESKGWFTNGLPELREYFLNGVPHGTRTTWFENGLKRSEGHLVAGLQEGLYRQWHEDGALAVEAKFEHGKPHGLSRAWYPSGSLKAEAQMSHGEVQTRQIYPEGVRQEPSLLASSQTH